MDLGLVELIGEVGEFISTFHEDLRTASVIQFMVTAFTFESIIIGSGGSYFVLYFLQRLVLGSG